VEQRHRTIATGPIADVPETELAVTNELRRNALKVKMSS